MKTELKKLHAAYETDASQIKGKATEVVFPESISDVKRAVQLYDKICIRGGGSGLVGGAVPQKEVVLDLSKLDHVGEVDTDRKIVEVESGVILDELQKVVGRAGLEFPVNPSSRSICTLGGMIATNAIGSRGVKYGATKDWVNWVEVVYANGDMERKSQTELSDYAGMEGITGVIVKASLKLSPKKIRTASLIKKKTLKEVHDEVLNSKRNGRISMVEFIDKPISKLIGLEEAYHLIIEYEGEEGKLQGEEYQELLDQRNTIGPLVTQEGYQVYEDPKIMLSKFETFMAWCEEYKVPVFGHLGVGILHPRFKTGQEDLIYEMMKLVKKLGGKISGEHGIGLSKKQFVDPNDKKILLNIKKRTDPEGKFNSGKML